MQRTVFIWGCGYLGFSNMLYYCNSGYRCVGIDTDPSIMEKILRGDYKADYVKLLQLPCDAFFRNGQASVTDNWKSCQNNLEDIHIICVPTEVDGKPFSGALYDVIGKIITLRKGFSQTAVMIESTMTFGTAEKLLRRLEEELSHELLFCVSPRRDWFTEGGKTLKTLPRVFGCNNHKAEDTFTSLLSSVCDTLVPATDYHYAELCKSVENSIRHLGITFANQLSDAFPEIDIREVLALAGTKWNINTYIPSFGPGGYCVPLSSQYILEGRDYQGLSLLQEAVNYTRDRPLQIAEQIDRLLPRTASVLVLGVAYMADVAVDKCSPISAIIQMLNNKGHTIVIHDPYFSEDYLRMRYKVGVIASHSHDYLRWQNYDAIILNAGHKEYSVIPIDYFKRIKKNSTIFDNTGIWKKYSDIINTAGRYRLIGEKTWAQL